MKRSDDEGEEEVKGLVFEEIYTFDNVPESKLCDLWFNQAADSSDHDQHLRVGHDIT